MIRAFPVKIEPATQRAARLAGAPPVKIEGMRPVRDLYPLAVGPEA